jgi:hypothetical protein
MVASVIANDSTPWATLKISDNNKSYVGLWKLYSCQDDVCTTTSYSKFEGIKAFDVCKKYGTGAGIMLIVAIVFSGLLFLLKFAHMLCRDPSGGYRKSLKVFFVIKTLAVFSLPIAAIAVWTENCYSEVKNSGADSIWSIGPGILILALIIEFIALYGIPAAWNKSKGANLPEA